jgi:TPR repeat protein
MARQSKLSLISLCCFLDTFSMSQPVATPQPSLQEFEQHLRQKVQQGDAVACLQIVEHFERKGLAPNKLESNHRIHLLMQASNQGVGAASRLLAHWYLQGHYVARDAAKAILFFEHAAKVCRDSYGFYELAKMFELGSGVKVDSAKAAQYLQKAVAMHNPDATLSYALQQLQHAPEQSLQLLKDNYKKHHHLPSLLYLNDTEALDQTKVESFFAAQQHDANVAGLLAFRHLKRGQLSQALPLADQSAQAQNPIGCHVRALIELQRPEGSAALAQQYMLQAAQLGHNEAAYQAALLLLQQADHSEVDAKPRLLQQAITLLAQAAQAGVVEAQFSLGQCLLQGVGVSANPQEGLAWMERAAQQGHVDAMFNLALHLPLEHAQHVPLLHAAAQAGHINAMICMGIYCQNQHQPEAAVGWFQQAQSRGSQRANYFLGLAYRDGTGVEADAKQAVELLLLAGEQGDADAYFALYQSYLEGIGVRKNKKSQAKYLALAQQAGHPQALSLQASQSED